MLFPCTLLALLTALAGAQAVGQQAEKPLKSREAKIYEMYYTDTLPPQPPKAPPPKKAVQKPAAPESGVQTLPVSHSEEQQGRRVGLKYKIKHCNGQCEVEYVDADHEFHTGDEIRLEIEANIDGYLYIINRGSTGRIQTLFPHESVNGGDNRIQRGVTYSIPAQGWIKFTGQPGEEHVTFIVSRTPLQSISGGPGSQEAGTPSAQEVVEELNRSVKSRDLAVVQERGPQISGQASSVQSTLVVNQSADNNNLVYTEVVLKHRAR